MASSRRTSGAVRWMHRRLAAGSAFRGGVVCTVGLIVAAVALRDLAFVVRAPAGSRGPLPLVAKPPQAKRVPTLTRQALSHCQSEADFDKAIRRTADDDSPDVLVVCFTTTWCGPCALMKPKLRELSKRFAGRAEFIEVVGDSVRSDGARIMEREHVRAMPLFLVYHKGRKIDSVAGVDPVSLQWKLEMHTGTLHQAVETPLENLRRCREAAWSELV
mmetsp:Transcript_120919/g.341991  ORF Transcript_120919/g.341991 Transcript_120919/m.341991 type:complete len:217 (-) Transcript_120919:89-739(-)